MCSFFVYIYLKNIAMHIRQLRSISRSLLPNDYVSCGYQKLDFSTAGAKAATVPTGAVYMEVRIESSVTTGIVGRYLNLGAGTAPTATDGMGVSHLDFFDFAGSDMVNNFRIIQTGAGTHIAHIQFFKKALS